jgi:hypothetical protein
MFRKMRSQLQGLPDPNRRDAKTAKAPGFVALNVAAKQLAEKVENCSVIKWRSRLATEKFPASQAFGAISGFLAHKPGSE